VVNPDDAAMLIFNGAQHHEGDLSRGEMPDTSWAYIAGQAPFQ
jgi:hypothetical protein